MIEHHDNITGVYFMITSTNLYVPVVILSINDNIKFLENIKKWFKKTNSWSKYRFEITTQTKNNNLDYLIHLTFRNINFLFVLLFKNDDNDPARNSFDNCYMPLVEIKHFNVLINNKPFFISQQRANKKRIKNLLKCQEMMIIQQEIY